MSMLISFFNKDFVASKCKTLLKLTIPRIKLLRNKREIQLKQTRRDVAKLLETGQEATARIRVEHILREEKIMASQEIIELFCELIVVRLPVIESQRECPLDLKEAISSVCFAAPRCADLPELLQVQQLFASKYGKEFVSAATELVPDCGVNPQLIERLSVHAPSPEKKLKLLKEISAEHELDWDPADSETEFFKKQEDLLNGPLEFFSASNSPLPEKKHNEASYFNNQPNKEPDSDSGSVSDTLEFPEVLPVQSNVNVATAPEMVTPPVFSHCEVDFHSSSHSGVIGEVKREQIERSIIDKNEPQTSGRMENKQFVPFISTTVSPTSFSARYCGSPHSLVRNKSEADVDLQDVLAAAHSTAEHATVAAESAASLAQMRINEVTKNNSECEPNRIFENPFYTDNVNWSATTERGHFTEKNIAGDYDCNRINDLGLHRLYNAAAATQPASSFAHVRSSELTKNNSERKPNSTYESPFYTGSSNQFATTERGHFIEKNTVGDHDNLAAATQSTATLAQGHSSGLTKKDNECDFVDTFENPFYTGSKNWSTTTERGYFIEKNTTGDYDSNRMNDLKLYQDYNAAVAAQSTTSLAQVRNSELTKKNSECKPNSTYENPFYAGSADQFATIEREHFTEKNIVGDYDNATASLVQGHISELIKKNSECDPSGTSENPFYTSSVNRYATTERGHFVEKNIVGNHNGRMNDLEPYKDYNAYPGYPGSQSSGLPSFDTTKADFDSTLPNYQVLDDKSSSLRPKNMPSMDDDLYSSYPNLFNFPNSNDGS